MISTTNPELQQNFGLYSRYDKVNASKVQVNKEFEAVMF
jgi:hypothetical protein